MIRTTIFAAIAGILLFAACGDNNKTSNTAKVELNFKADFGGAPLTMFSRAYPYSEGMNVRFQNFLFYVSDVKLIRDDGATQLLSEVELVSFKNVQDDAAANRGITVATADVPAGTYKALQFGIGVAPALNGTQPGDYKPGHPLTDNYWSWALGYIFTKIEGNADLDGDGGFDENAKLTFHIGANELYKVKTFDKNIVVRAGEPLTLPFQVDLRRVLVTPSGNFLDFRAVRQDHTNDMNVARFIMDNLNEAVIAL